MALWDWVTRQLALSPVEGPEVTDNNVARTIALTESRALQTRSIDQFNGYPDLDTQLLAVQGLIPRPWRAPSIAEALGVPAIQRAVTLISNTVGSLSMIGYRDGAPMQETPRLMARPNPWEPPHVFYRDTAYNQASRGEFVWWIASRDSDNLATALVVVPLAELQISANERNRLRPIYQWGDKVSTRWTPASPDGQFVHGTYLKEPGALRGMGPMQMCGVALSVSVESEEWAANFYADGGYPNVILRKVGRFSQDPVTGQHEADGLREQYARRDPNTPMVVDDMMGEIERDTVDPSGAQMLGARQHNKGDAANMFGIPGPLLEYSAPGSSLTYGNRTDLWRDFHGSCLAPNYLEPIEQAMSDLQVRSVVGRFDVDQLLRADVKTRYEVYGIGIDKGIFAPEYAAQKEGIQPGDIEFRPVPFAPPAAVPNDLPKVRSAEAVRCTGKRIMKGILKPCGKLLAEAGPFVGTCSRCGKRYEQAA